MPSFEAGAFDGTTEHRPFRLSTQPTDTPNRRLPHPIRCAPAGTFSAANATRTHLPGLVACSRQWDVGRAPRSLTGRTAAAASAGSKACGQHPTRLEDVEAIQQLNDQEESTGQKRSSCARLQHNPASSLATVAQHSNTNATNKQASDSRDQYDIDSKHAKAGPLLRSSPLHHCQEPDPHSQREPASGREGCNPARVDLLLATDICRSFHLSAQCL